MNFVLASRAIAAALALTLVGTAFAQDSQSPSVRAVVAFMNILDHEAVSTAEGRARNRPQDVADELLEQLEARGVLRGEIVAPMRAALPEETVPRDAFVLFLADLLNGAAALSPLDADEAEESLASTYCGLEIPAGSLRPDGSGDVLRDSDVSLVVGRFVASYDCILPALRDTYGDPVE